MTFTEIKSLNEKQKHEIIDLWNNEYPKKLSHSGLAEFEQYLQGLSDKHHILLTDEDGVVKGWLVYFIRNNERWFAMILASTVQGRGFGSRFLNLAKKHNPELNGWVIDHDNERKANGENYRSPLGFYKKNGFEVISDFTFEPKNIKGLKVKWKNNGSQP